MANRRERFRKYMAKLSATADPRSAVKERLYVKQPGRSVGDQIASRLELEPASSHLLVGSVGSGKTTQLAAIEMELKHTSDIRTRFVDVGRYHDLSRLQTGVLIVVAGLVLSPLVKESMSDDVKKTKERFRRWAHGWVEWVEDLPDDDDWEPPDDWEPAPRTRPVRYKGVLVPPEPALKVDIREKADHLKVLREAVASTGIHPILLLDSLDRLASPNIFAELVMQDVRAMRAAGVGVVVVGPLNTMFGPTRTTADRFDYFYHQSSVDVLEDKQGREFLFAVLRRRADIEVLPDESAWKIVEACGGVLRDLISIARSSGEEAYTAGSEVVEESHVAVAVDAFGRTLMLGLDADELAVLQRVRTSGNFVPTSDKDLALLATRRVLEYGTGRRFAVHPTIVPLLEQLA
jgi:Cdc6-like AAA superfamily ATPase